MSHEVHKMAYVGATPWHGLGNELQPGQPIETWIKEAGFDYEILRGQTLFRSEDGNVHTGLGEHLYRSDTMAPLSTVSSQYKVVQPSVVMDFFREVCKATGFALETAGVLKGGAVYWGLAKTDKSIRINGSDKTEGYVLLASSADKSLATIAKLTSVRVVCWNTLSAAAARSGDKAFKTIHTKAFDMDEALATLGLGDYARTFEQFGDQLSELVHKPMSKSDASDFFSELLRPGSTKERDQAKTQTARAGGFADFRDLMGQSANLSNVHSLKTDGGRFIPEHASTKERAIRGHADLMMSYENAPGACPGTAYGALQGVTHYVDHVRGKADDKRLHSAWFGQGDRMKQSAFKQLLEI